MSHFVKNNMDSKWRQWTVTSYEVSVAKYIKALVKSLHQVRLSWCLILEQMQALKGKTNKWRCRYRFKIARP